MNKNTQQSLAQKNRIDVGTNVFFKVNVFREKGKARGIVKQVNGDLLVIQNRSGGEHNRNVREVQRV